MLNEDFFKNMELGDGADNIMQDYPGEKNRGYIDFAWKGDIYSLGTEYEVAEALKDSLEHFMINSDQFEDFKELSDKYFNEETDELEFVVEDAEKLLFEDNVFEFGELYSKMWANGDTGFEISLTYNDEVYYAKFDLTAKEIELVARQMIKAYEKEQDIEKPYYNIVYESFRKNYQSVINEKYCSEMDEQRLEQDNEEVER